MMPPDAQPWSTAAAPIWNLVCHFPSEKRRKCPLFMLRAYVDDSGSADGPAVVLGGLIAPAENWAKFADDWLLALNMRPPMEYYKMSEIAARGWADEEFAIRLRFFHRIMEENVVAACACIVEHAIIDEALSRFRMRVVGLTPYRLAFERLMHHVIDQRPALGLAGKIEFIFDKQTESKEVHALWAGMLEKNPLLESGVADEPQFRDDKQVLPLQAADHYAWWCRRRWIESATGSERLIPPWKSSKPIPQMTLTFTVDQILEILEACAKDPSYLKPWYVVT